MIEEKNAPEVTSEVTPEAKPEPDPILESLKNEDDQPAEDAEEKPENSVKEPEKPAEQEVEEKKESEAEDENLKSEQEDQSEPKEDTEEGKELDPKEEARRRYEERQKVKAATRAQIEDHTKDFINDPNVDEAEQRLRRMEVNDFQRTVENTQNTLVSEIDRVKANPDLQIFNPESEKFDSKLYEYAIAIYNDAYIDYDQFKKEDGTIDYFPIGLKKSLFEHLKKTAELYRGSFESGQFQQVRDQKKMKINADSKPAAPPQEKTEDPLTKELLSDN